jgi:hypothetical protein
MIRMDMRLSSRTEDSTAREPPTADQQRLIDRPARQSTKTECLVSVALADAGERLGQFWDSAVVTLRDIK